MPFTSGKGFKNVEETICKRLEESAKAINDAYGSYIVAAKPINGEIIILVGESTIKKTKVVAEAIHYLEGLKRGIELMKGEM